MEPSKAILWKIYAGLLGAATTFVARFIGSPAMNILPAKVVETGSFEKAAKALNVTPSAVSQRVRQLEERLGAVLVGDLEHDGDHPGDDGGNRCRAR